MQMGPTGITWQSAVTAGVDPENLNGGHGKFDNLPRESAKFMHLPWIRVCSVCLGERVEVVGRGWHTFSFMSHNSLTM